MDIQEQKSQNVEKADKGKTAISTNAPVPGRRGQPSKVFERKDHSSAREGGRSSDCEDEPFEDDGQRQS